MRTALPTDLLLRLMNATPEQYAAVCRILGCDGDGREKRGESESKNQKAEMELEAEPVGEDVARQAFALLQKLELDAPLKAPSVLTVFRMYCVDGYSADRIAQKCRCGKGTVMSRLRFIEEKTKMKPEEFRAVSGHLQQIDDELHASGAREIYRRGLANSDEE